MHRVSRCTASIVAISLLVAAEATAQNVGGLGAPLFGLATAPNGDLVVADASTGLLTIRDGAAGVSVPLPGATDASAIGHGALWASTGASGGPTGAASDTGQGVHRVSPGASRKLVSLFAFEAANNPDGRAIESNPFDIQSLGGDAALVADAAGNTLLEVTNQGDVRVLAVFPNEIVSTANLKQLAHCPSPAPFCGLPPAMPAQLAATRSRQTSV